MWQYYRKTFIPTQLLIVLICVALGVHWQVPIASLVVYFLVMELFALFGAMWSNRQLRKLEGRQNLLRPPR